MPAAQDAEPVPPTTADPVPVAVAGASGRMGRMLIAALDATPRARLAAAMERPGHDWIGADLGVALGGAPRGLAVTDDPAAALRYARGVIDFTAPGPSAALAGQAAAVGVACVIGTTGFAASDLAAIAAAARTVPVVRAGNMSLGVNLLVQITRQVARALDASWDVEVVEAHHRHKADAPSGTALMLGAAAAEGRGHDLDAAADRGRDGLTGPRTPGAIGFSAIRGGDIVGEHDVIFAAEGERVVLRHVATDRAIFARGAVAAALWAVGRAPGEYDMLDVLDLRV